MELVGEFFQLGRIVDLLALRRHINFERPIGEILIEKREQDPLVAREPFLDKDIFQGILARLEFRDDFVLPFVRKEHIVQNLRVILLDERTLAPAPTLFSMIPVIGSHACIKTRQPRFYRPF